MRGMRAVMQVEVILNYNRTLLSRLEQRMQNWHSLGQCLGDIFLQVVRGRTGPWRLWLRLTPFVPLLQTVFLKVYTTYVNNYNTTIQLLTDAAKNREAAKFLTVPTSPPPRPTYPPVALPSLTPNLAWRVLECVCRRPR
jgi:hypothetical protein